MRRPLRPDEQKVWALVAGTVHPLPGRAAERVPTREEKAVEVPARIDPTQPAAGPKSRPRDGVDGIEPNRRHRIVREREAIGARLDLHGMDQDRARPVLEAFLERAWNEGYRAVLVITGKGVQGDGVLRRRAPEWLGAAHLSHIVAGISEAGRRHGGAGALYVALKRKPRV
jgi:DNA-nicking Smr family endonuclease